MRRGALLLTLLLALLPTAVPAHAADSATSTVMLVVDVSGSMTGDRIKTARPAIEDFLRAIPKSVNVGLITFSTRAKLVVPITNDREVMLKAVSTLRTAGDTALIDAINLAINTLKDQPGARIVVLSDGADTSSKGKLTALVKKLAGSAIPVDVIALQPTAKHISTLQKFVATTGGRLLTASGIDKLVATFKEASQVFSPTPTPTPTATQNPDGSTAAATRTFEDWIPLGLAVSMLISLLLLAFTALDTLRNTFTVQRVKRYVSDYSEVLQKSFRARRRSLEKEAILAYFEQRFPKTVIKLDEANIQVAIHVWVGIVAGSSALMFVMLSSITRAWFIGLILTAFLTWQVPKLIFTVRISSRRREFGDELPNTLGLIASSLRAGLTFAQAVDTAVADGEGEMARQMRRALNEIAVGATVESALMGVANRMDSEDFRWVVTALSIQREVGGSLAKILDTATNTIRGRVELQREVRTLSAEGRLSAYILAALPVGILIFLTISRPEYVAIFWTTALGYLMLAMMLAAFIVGWIWVNKLVKIRV